MSFVPLGRTVTHPDWMARRGGVVPWDEVERKLEVARDYWVAFAWRIGDRDFHDYHATRFEFSGGIADV